MTGVRKPVSKALQQALRQEPGGSRRVEPAPWLADDGPGWQSDPLISSHPIGGYHHIGTTRMSASPRTGVVNADGRVHGLRNLYVVGSSTFPTARWANPTLTIAALALRTADRVSAMLVNLRRASGTPLAHAWNDDVLQGRKMS